MLKGHEQWRRRTIHVPTLNKRPWLRTYWIAESYECFYFSSFDFCSDLLLVYEFTFGHKFTWFRPMEVFNAEVHVAASLTMEYVIRSLNSISWDLFRFFPSFFKNKFVGFNVLIHSTLYYKKLHEALERTAAINCTSDEQCLLGVSKLW